MAACGIHASRGRPVLPRLSSYWTRPAEMSVEDSPRDVNQDDQTIAITVMSTDPVLRQLLEGFGARIQLRFVEEWQALIDVVRQQQRSVVLLDADQADPLELARHVAELNALPHPPVIVEAADHQRAKASMDRVNAGLVHRILLKPANPGTVRLTLESAVNRSRQQRPALGPLLTPQPARGRGKLIVAGVGLLVVLGLIAVLVLRLDSDDVPERAAPELVAAPPVSEPESLEAAAGEPSLTLADETEPAPEPTVALATTEDDAEFEASAALETAAAAPGTAAAEPSLVELAAIAAARAADADAAAAAALAAAEAEAARLAPAREIDRLIARAQAQLQAGALIQPEPESVISYYRRAAAIDSGDAAVTALRSRLAAALVAAVPGALAVGDTETAERLIDGGAELAVSQAVLSDLSAQLASLVARQEAERQAEREAGLLSAGLQRMNAQQFFTPADDSAAYYLATLRLENPDHPGLSGPLAELVAVLVETADQSIAAGEADLADDAIDWLRQLGVDDGALTRLANELASVRRQQDFLRVPAALNELRVLHMEPAVFPSAALRRHREGWVDVDLIVGRDGLPREIEVVDAEPGGVFERAALTAIRRYRFEPFELDGNLYERRLGLRLVFSAD